MVQVLEILSIRRAIMVVFRNILKFMKEKEKNVLDLNVKVKLSVLLFQIGPLFIVIFVKNKKIIG